MITQIDKMEIKTVVSRIIKPKYLDKAIENNMWDTMKISQIFT